MPRLPWVPASLRSTERGPRGDPWPSLSICELRSMPLPTLRPANWRLEPGGDRPPFRRRAFSSDTLMPGKMSHLPKEAQAVRIVQAVNSRKVQAVRLGCDHSAKALRELETPGMCRL